MESNMPKRGARALGQWLDKLSESQAVVLAYGLLALLFLFDYLTPSEASFSILYMIPVVIIGWRSSLMHSVIVSLLAALFLGEVSEHSRTHPIALWIYFWNPATRFVIYLGIATLLRELRTTIQELSILSSIDSLTGVRNRRAFVELLGNELSRHRRSRHPISVAFIDLDRFKEINDTHGHQKGDRALLAVAGLLRTHLRKSDVVGRIGGDEFGVVMPETARGGALSALAAIRPGILELEAKLGFPITLSVGVASVTGRATAAQLMHEADMVMYEVKHDGGNDIRHREFVAK
jgi:diguanylate cyclase (GGDEF)-like protein